jgi:hypothetical protein
LQTHTGRFAEPPGHCAAIAALASAQKHGLQARPVPKNPALQLHRTVSDGLFGPQGPVVVAFRSHTVHGAQERPSP